MPKWILGRTLTLIGILGAPFSAAQAQSLNSGFFSSESEAREYLRKFPTGPRANAAFLALSEFRLTEDNPGLTREQIMSGFGYQGALQTTQVRQRASSGGSSMDINTPPDPEPY